MKHLLQQIWEATSCWQKIVFFLISLMLAFGISLDTFIKAAAHLGIYKGTPVVIYVEEDIATAGFGLKQSGNPLKFETKEARNLKLIRIEPVYIIHYMPSHLQKLPNPQTARENLWQFGYEALKEGKKQWQETSVASSIIPYVEFPQGLSMPESKDSGAGRAAIWVEKGLAMIARLNPIDEANSYKDSVTDKEYVRIYPIHIKGIGTGYTFIEKYTTLEEQQQRNWPETITVGIQKEYLSKVEYDKSK